MFHVFYFWLVFLFFFFKNIKRFKSSDYYKCGNKNKRGFSDVKLLRNKFDEHKHLKLKRTDRFVDYSNLNFMMSNR